MAFLANLLIYIIHMYGGVGREKCWFIVEIRKWQFLFQLKTLKQQQHMYRKTRAIRLQ